MTKTRRLAGAAGAVAAIGLAACGGGDHSGAAATTKPPASVAAPASTPPPAPSTTDAPVSTVAPTTIPATTIPATTIPATTVQSAPPTGAPPALVLLPPGANCPSKGASGHSDVGGAPLVCLEVAGGLRWAAVVQSDLSDATRQALLDCAAELSSLITTIAGGGRFATAHCDAATGVVAAGGVAPYLVLIQQQLADCRAPLSQYANDRRSGVTYDDAKLLALVNDTFACKSTIEGFANTKP